MDDEKHIDEFEVDSGGETLLCCFVVWGIELATRFFFTNDRYIKGNFILSILALLFSNIFLKDDDNLGPFYLIDYFINNISNRTVFFSLYKF